MSADHGHDHSHDHGHDEHDHHGHHHHHHDGPAAPGAGWRYTAAGVLVLLGALAATLFTVRAGNAVVVTRFGSPVRVILEPGLAWKLPAPIERTVEVDLRLHTTASGIHGVQTRDGLSVVVQTFAAWQIPANADSVTRFLRAVENRPEEAANRLRTFLGSSMETVTGRFDLAALVNTDPAKVRLGEYEGALQERIGATLAGDFGIQVASVGVERLMLPESTVAATVTRMSAERDTVAEEKKAAGRRLAGEIRSQADRDSRIIKAKAEEEASVIEAVARKEAAAIYGKAHAADPQLYAYLRSLDTLDQVVTASTRLVLRTDAAPFKPLVEAPALPASVKASEGAK